MGGKSNLSGNFASFESALLNYCKKELKVRLANGGHSLSDESLTDAARMYKAQLLVLINTSLSNLIADDMNNLYEILNHQANPVN